jgi:SAM-dependent methyltransferase
MNYVEGAGNIRHGDDWTWSPNLWDHLVNRYAINSVLDVGCGEGHSVNYFRKLGTISHGIDGSMDNVKRAVTPIQWHRFEMGPLVYPVDLVWCSEVAEHVPEQFVDSFLSTLCNGNVVAMTAALPGQGGYGHVNEQNPDYWIDHMQDHHFTFSESATNACREVSIELDGVNCWFNRTGLVFFRND